MRQLIKFLSVCVAGLLAVAASYCFFMIIPLLHNMFGVDLEQSQSKHQIRAVAELIKKPKPPENKPVQQHVRKVNSNDSHKSRGNSQMNTKFVPDLSVDASGAGDGVALQTKDLSAEVFEDGETDEPAQQEYMPPIDFPDRAREMGITGVVEVRFTITYEGKVAGTEIISSPDRSLTSEVLKALSKARFKPARNKNVPVNVRVKKTFEFNLE